MKKNAMGQQPSEKMQQWEQMKERVSRMVDRLGKPVDKGIAETIIVLNLLGIPTRQSCAGHLKWGVGAPWVDIESKDKKIQELMEKERSFIKMANKRREEQGGKITNEVAKLYTRAHRYSLQAKKRHAVIHQRLLDFLATFYQDRIVPYDVQLIAYLRGNSTMLESHGAGLQDVTPLPLRKERLAAYQQEMRDFTAFLKQRFFEG